MSYVFIAFAHKDHHFVDRLREDLKQAYISCWIDYTGMKKGTVNWEHAIRRAIKDSSAVIWVVSPASYESEYVSSEIAVANMHKIEIYPVFADGDHWIEYMQDSIQYVDMRQDKYRAGLESLVKVLRHDKPDLTVSESNTLTPNSISPTSTSHNLPDYNLAHSHDQIYNHTPDTHSSESWSNESYHSYVSSNDTHHDTEDRSSLTSNASNLLNSENQVKKDSLFEAAPSVSEDISFTHFYPSIVDTNIEEELHIYVHLTSALEKVIADYNGRKNTSQPTLSATETSSTLFKRGTVFTIVPTIKGARIIPNRADVEWIDDFEHIRFSLKVKKDIQPLLSLTGSINIYVGTLIVAQLPLVAGVMKESNPDGVTTKSDSRLRFKKLFLSYSHRDTLVVKAIDRIYQKYPELETYIDYKFLQSSDYWWPAIQDRIEKSEALQLFWSVDASNSPNVADEWRYALKLPRPIMPIMIKPDVSSSSPSIPPELQHIHFEDYEHFIGRL